MRPARIILLVVALLAGGLAAFLATRGGTPEPVPEVAQVVEAAGTKVLTAKVPIGVAERLSAENVEWLDWPQSAVQPDYVTIDAMPNAPTELAGSVARFEFFPGEPIRQVKLVHADEGYLSAVLEQGKRGISIAVTGAAASGGFIVPNDRVDVVLTRGSSGAQVSETILSNVKVLAIGRRLGQVGTTGAPADPEDPKQEVFDQAIATLELDPGQGETLINASQSGSLSLALRSMADFNQTVEEVRQASNQSVRVIRYGAETNVMSGNAPPPAQPATVDPAAFNVPVYTPTPQVSAPAVQISAPAQPAAPPPPPAVTE